MATLPKPWMLCSACFWTLRSDWRCSFRSSNISVDNGANSVKCSFCHCSACLAAAKSWSNQCKQAIVVANTKYHRLTTALRACCQGGVTWRHQLNLVWTISSRRQKLDVYLGMFLARSTNPTETGHCVHVQPWWYDATLQGGSISDHRKGDCHHNKLLRWAGDWKSLKNSESPCCWTAAVALLVTSNWLKKALDVRWCKDKVLCGVCFEKQNVSSEFRSWIRFSSMVYQKSLSSEGPAIAKAVSWAWAGEFAVTCSLLQSLKTVRNLTANV